MRQLAIGILFGAIAAGCAHERASDDAAPGPHDSDAASDVEASSSGHDASNAQVDAGSGEAIRDGGTTLDLSPSPPVPEGWVRVTGEYGVSLAAPAPGLSAKPARCGTDSCSVPFEGGECSYSAERNSFVDRLEHYASPDYVVENLRVDGMAARFVEGVRPEPDGNYMLAVCLYVPNGIRAGVDLGVAGAFARCPSAASAVTARAVLQTLALAPAP